MFTLSACLCLFPNVCFVEDDKYTVNFLDMYVQTYALAESKNMYIKDLNFSFFHFWP